MPPTAKQYMEAVAARLLIRNLHLALPSLLPRLTNYVHRQALGIHTPLASCCALTFVPFSTAMLDRKLPLALANLTRLMPAAYICCWFWITGTVIFTCLYLLSINAAPGM